MNDIECPTCGLLTCLDDGTGEQYCHYCEHEFDYSFEDDEVIV